MLRTALLSCLRLVKESEGQLTRSRQYRFGAAMFVSTVKDLDAERRALMWIIGAHAVVLF